MKYYKPLCTFEVIADNYYYGVKSKRIYLYKDEIFSIWNKQKDMFDSECEHWATYDGWLIKIERDHLAHLEEVDGP